MSKYTKSHKKYYDKNRKRILKAQKEYNEKHKDRYRQNTKNWSSKNGKRMKEWTLKTFYNLSLDEFNDIFEKQNGCCAICGIHQSQLKKTLCVDHDHKTGQIRGLLCNKCNRGIGMFNDDVILLETAIKYLKT